MIISVVRLNTLLKISKTTKVTCSKRFYVNGLDLRLDFFLLFSILCYKKRLISCMYTTYLTFFPGKKLRFMQLKYNASTVV
jgi:hypothetical protein